MHPLVDLVDPEVLITLRAWFDSRRADSNDV